MFDNLVRDYHRDFPSELRDDEERRKKYMPMDVSNTPKSAQTHSGFNDMIQAATGIGYTPGEFMNKLAKKSGFKDHVHSWARGTIPNGLARKIILTCAEDMLRKRGARPEMSLLEAAAWRAILSLTTLDILKTLSLSGVFFFYFLKFSMGFNKKAAHC